MIGETLGHYEILDKLGEGGMGVVYKATDQKLGREVAVKVLRRELVEDQERRRRFLREARSAAAASHPNIASIFEVGDSAGCYFIVMEFVEGETLRQLMKRGRLPLSEALRIGVDIGKGLARAHDAGVIHRDLKPENVMVSNDGHVKILDFGLARLVAPAYEHSVSSTAETITEGLTLPGTLLGTVAYMSPEQARGLDVDPRSDLFSYGVLIYEMVTGKLPFEGATAVDMLGSIIKDPAIPATDQVPDLPPKVAQVLERLLAKEPAERYHSAENALADLSELPGLLAPPARRSLGIRSRAHRRDKLCVCGHSKQLPLCDGSHDRDDWSCASQTDRARLGFLASRRYENLALKLASHYDGVLCPGEEGSPTVETLVVLVDGSDLEVAIDASNLVEADHRVVISFTVAAELLADLFPRSRYITLEDVDALHAFKRITSILDGAEPAGQATQPERKISLKSAFISHAVADEPKIMPVVDYLQHFFRTDLFTCADSITPGSAWQQKIDRALRAKDCFVYVISAASRGSPFCAFEVGVASALEKPIYVISLDGSLPPAFLQHLQTVDLARLQRRKSWLEEEDILLEELLRVLR